MKKLMALFAALILLACGAAQAESVQRAMSNVWGVAWALGDTVAWALDRDGVLWRWPYDDGEAEAWTRLPVVTSEMFNDYSLPYPELPAENRAQIDETVSLLAPAGEMLYALNKFCGRIGTVGQAGVQWSGSFDASPLLDDEGYERVIFSKTVIGDALYLLVDYWQEAPAAACHTRVLRISLPDGETRMYDACEGAQMCAYGADLLLQCEEENGKRYLMTLAPESGETRRLELTLPATDMLCALAYDGSGDRICLADGDVVFVSAQGAEFRLAANLPARAYGSGTILADGRYAFLGDGVCTMQIGEENAKEALTLRLHSNDPVLRAAFAEQYPQVMLNWQVDHAITAADVAEAIRSGDGETDLFSMQADGAFGRLLEKGYAAALTDEGILQSVARMYPVWQRVLTDESGRVVALPWSIDVFGGWQVNRQLYERYFGDTPYPATWRELFAMMLDFDETENEDGDLFLDYYDPDELAKKVLLSYIAQRETDGTAVDFSDPALADALTALAQVRDGLRQQGIECYDEMEIFWDSEIGGEHSLFCPDVSYSDHSAYLGKEGGLQPLTFSAGEQPVWQASLRVLTVNPLSKRQALAQDFAAVLVSADYGVMHGYLLFADCTAPCEQKPYRITAQAVADWQQAVERLYLPVHSALMSEAFTAQMETLISRYNAGQIDIASMLRQLNEIARTVERERQ